MEGISPIGIEKEIYQGRVFQVVEQQMNLGGETTVFERVRRAPGVRLIIYCPKEEKVLLTREYRAEVEGYDFRLPGGKVFNKLDAYLGFVEEHGSERVFAEAVAAAKNEAAEEVGLDLSEIEPTYLGKQVDGATVEWDLYYFRVEVPDMNLGEQDLEAGEDITPMWMSYEEAWEKCLNGDVGEGRSGYILMRFLHEQMGK